MKLKLFSKKLILLTVVFSLISSLPGIFNPYKAEAKIVHDPWHTAVSASGWAVQKVFVNVLEEVRKAMRDAVVYGVLNVISDEVIGWVQGGGEPKFVGNWESYLGSNYAKGQNEVIEEIPADYICVEFRDNVQRDLGVIFSANPKASKDDYSDIKCTLYEGGDSAAPQNNRYAVTAFIEEKMAIRGTRKAQSAQNEAIAGRGYISPKKCLESDDFGRCLQEIITTPGASVADVIERVLTSNIEFMSNVQSPFSALVNALVSRLINTGLKEIGLSTMPGGKTYSYQDTAYSGAVKQDLEFQKQTIISTYQRFLNEKQSVLSIKKQSLEIANQIASSTCPAAGDIQGKINTLNSEIAGLESIINRLNNLIAGARSGTAEYYAEQMPIVGRLYQEFMAQYGEQIYQDIYTGNARNAAQQELQELRRIQERCFIKI